ncbi:MAG: helix-turn-helix transcriptional regulator [Candidatus Magasanikbacteria bacterium]|nr:helix-turn-helix transcriptional regulator [Candidatus Magasanikbacteria bacterium]
MPKQNKGDTEKKIKTEIAANIKRIRRSTRSYLTAKTVADKLGVSRVAYTHVENGKNHVNGVTLWKLSTLFGCDIKEFFPITPDGYALSPKDIENIKKKDEEAVHWAQELWGLHK